jgi:hypothetical protein
MATRRYVPVFSSGGRRVRTGPTPSGRGIAGSGRRAAGGDAGATENEKRHRFSADPAGARKRPGPSDVLSKNGKIREWALASSHARCRIKTWAGRCPDWAGRTMGPGCAFGSAGSVRPAAKSRRGPGRAGARWEPGERLGYSSCPAFRCYHQSLFKIISNLDSSDIAALRLEAPVRDLLEFLSEVGLNGGVVHSAAAGVS